MKYILTIIFFLFLFIVKGQGTLNSKLWPDTLSKECILKIQNFDDWNNPNYHYFNKSTSTYLNKGNYKIIYYYDDKLIHSEWIHVSNDYILIKKLIFVKTLSLTKVTFDPKGSEYLFIDIKSIKLNK